MKVPPTVPFLDLAAAHEPLKAGILDDISAVLDASAFINGPQVDEFERSFASYCRRAECVGVGSGTDAIRIALLAAGVAPGDEVIVPANTFIATIEAITQAGGAPVLVDASDADYNIDVGAAASAVTTRTRFLLPVHLYGQMADMRALLDLATQADLLVVEDACQAHGAERAGVKAGEGGLVGAFSFYPGKNLGAFGDAGALVTDDHEVAARARALREHGQRRKHVHELEGYTARLDTIQALVLLHKLPLLDLWNEQRRSAARWYEHELRDVGDLILPPCAEGSDPVWHLYVVRTQRPTDLAAYLAERGIATGRHYPIPPHLSPAYAHLGHPAGAFPVTEQLARDGLSLPIFPGIDRAQLGAVAETIRSFFRTGGALQARPRTA